MSQDIDRREFVGRVTGLAIGLGLGAVGGEARAESAKPWFKISLAEWSFHKALFAGTMDHLDFAKVAKTDFGIDAVEYVNQFFKDKAKDQKYLDEMKKRAEDHGVQSVLIMCD